MKGRARVRGAKLLVLSSLVTLMGILLGPVSNAAATEPLHYYGGEVIAKPHVYLTFWGKKWNEYSAARTEVREMFAHLSGSAWQGILTQYFGQAGFVSSEVISDSWTDETISAASNVNDAALVQEIQYAQAQRGWPGAGINNFYFVLPAPGTTYIKNICAVHHYSGTLGAPWGYAGWAEDGSIDCRSADPSGNKLLARALTEHASHEYSEAVTDPVTPEYAGQLTGWVQPALGAAGEIADLCPTGGGQMAGGYYVTALWDNYQNKCSLSDPSPLSGTQTEVEASALNGNPGWATVKGHVFSGVTVNNKVVNINLKKKEGGSYVFKSSIQVPVNNNSYELKDWNGVGPGEWVAKVVFPAQAPYGESSSIEATEGHFLVKDGYRIVNKNSGKCLDVYYASKENGASTKQQYCADPTVFENQVFTLAPEGNGYLRLKPRHSGGCLEIAGASQENTALLQQWACNGSAQQSWQPVTLETVGGTQYIRLIAKHSGKCLDVLAGSKADGASVGQWECNTTAQQKWSLQSVDSAPVATETFATAPEYERLNGQPGYATVRGWVKTGYYGIPAGDNWVNLNYEKEVSPGNFSLIKTNHPTLNSEGFYEVQYEGLAAGNWRIWTGFQGSTAASPALAASQSPKVSVQINSGYRFVFRHSGKCLTLSGNNPAAGTPIVQWACNASASPGDGQVFTLVPMGNGYFEVKVNSSGRCLDVKEWSQSPGTWLRQYDCWGPEQSNQLWQVVPIAGQSPWNAFMVKHSGQCADVYASSTANGANVVQWYCNWGGQQQWSFQGVN